MKVEYERPQILKYTDKHVLSLYIACSQKIAYTASFTCLERCVHKQGCVWQGETERLHKPHSHWCLDQWWSPHHSLSHTPLLESGTGKQYYMEEKEIVATLTESKNTTVAVVMYSDLCPLCKCKQLQYIQCL